MSTPLEHPLVPPSEPRQAPPAYPDAARTWPQPPPGAAFGGPPGAGYSGWVQPQLSAPQDPDAAVRKARTALGWAIGAAVGAFVALAVAMVALLLGGVGAGYGEFDDGLPYESVRGQVSGVTDGAALPGSYLEASMSTALDEWYVELEDLSCPDTKAVTTSTAVVCTAEIDGFDWTGVAYFEDVEGRFVILEL